MFALTARERKVLLFIGILIFCGAVLKFLNVNFSKHKLTCETDEITTESSSQNIPIKQLVVNINTAAQEELERLPGIGPEIARRIVEYCQTKSRFVMLEDLKKVKGIGDKKLEAIKRYIVF
jgi:comEA protein